MSELKQKILMIDDDRDLVRSVQAFLTGRGYEVITAHNSTEGLEQIRQGNPDLIVLDIMMDYDAEGFNLAYKLKGEESTRRIPIIILSGFAQQLDEKMASFEFILGRDWPAASMMEKPADLKKLAALIGELLAQD